ncbi:LytTR family transcriptional regulator DNA-binding domain-containing protein [Ruminiclostridium papyrosolvens]|uniref:LytTR family transcriptional regulator DNA-binding domain-containing protein n=1 Tax=Ruminiclostridium papyrosolvens TaxID=29362 RepID=UPI0009DBCAD5|nr:LytTR family DNA-binding domain-containing protein [Ruminiclostridium papyrosolvens]
MHFKDGTKLELREKLDTIEEQISGQHFIRCHQSYVVNLNYIKCIENGIFITTLNTPVLIRNSNDFNLLKADYNWQVYLHNTVMILKAQQLEPKLQLLLSSLINIYLSRLYGSDLMQTKMLVKKPEPVDSRSHS